MFSPFITSYLTFSVLAEVSVPPCLAAPAYLVHALLVEPHDGAVCEPIEDGAQALCRVDGLRSEQLLNEAAGAHQSQDIVQNCGV